MDIKKSATHRKCKYPGCEHVLSIYNHSAYCNVHIGVMSREDNIKEAERVRVKGGRPEKVKDKKIVKKCKKCGVPLEGVLYNLIAAKIFRVKPSDKDPGICNKCIDKPGN